MVSGSGPTINGQSKQLRFKLLTNLIYRLKRLETLFTLDNAYMQNTADCAF